MNKKRKCNGKKNSTPVLAPRLYVPSGEEVPQNAIKKKCNEKKNATPASACGCTVGRGSADDMQVALIQQLSQVEVVVRQAAV